MDQALVPPSPMAVSATFPPILRREEQGPMAPATLNSREVSTYWFVGMWMACVLLSLWMCVYFLEGYLYFIDSHTHTYIYK